MSTDALTPCPGITADFRVAIAIVIKLSNVLRGALWRLAGKGLCLFQSQVLVPANVGTHSAAVTQQALTLAACAGVGQE